MPSVCGWHPDIVPLLSTPFEHLREIHSKGFLPTVTRGDTGVGMTLEAHLGLPPNCNRAPDYKGIELKASRMNQTFRTPNRVNLFTLLSGKNQRTRQCRLLRHIKGV